MGFYLVPRDASVGDLFVNLWNWHPTVNLIASFNLIDPQRLELLHNQCGGEISAEEAVQIAGRIEQEVLAELPNDGRVLLSLLVTTESDDFTHFKGNEFVKNYSATAEWPSEFVAFCRSSRGFDVL